MSKKTFKDFFVIENDITSYLFEDNKLEIKSFKNAKNFNEISNNINEISNNINVLKVKKIILSNIGADKISLSNFKNVKDIEMDNCRIDKIIFPNKIESFEIKEVKEEYLNDILSFAKKEDTSFDFFACYFTIKNLNILKGSKSTLMFNKCSFEIYKEDIPFDDFEAYSLCLKKLQKLFLNKNDDFILKDSNVINEKIEKINLEFDQREFIRDYFSDKLEIFELEVTTNTIVPILRNDS